MEDDYEDIYGYFDSNIDSELELLHRAVNIGDINTIKTFSDKLNLINKYQSDVTAMHIAAKNGSLEIIKMLIDMGASIDPIDNPYRKSSPLYYAVKKGHVDVIKFLLSLNAIHGPESDDPVTGICSNYWMYGTNARRCNVYLWDYRDRPMKTAIRKGNCEIVKLLYKNINPKASLDIFNMYRKKYVSAAVSYGQDEVIKTFVSLDPYFLKMVSKSYNNKETLVYRAAQGNHSNTIRTLFSFDSNLLDKPDYDGRTPLWVAAYCGGDDAIKTLIDLGSKTLDKTDNRGIPPLFAAARQLHVNAVELLLKLGSKSLFSKNYDQTILKYMCDSNMYLYYASNNLEKCKNKIKSVVLVLLAYGASTEDISYVENFISEIIWNITEDEMYDTRYRIFFNQSLCNKLCVAMV